MATEVFNRIGESEIYDENPFHKRQRRENYDNDEEEIESKSTKSKALSEAKKEFFEHINDDSLSLDTCTKLNHDWKKE